MTIKYACNMLYRTQSLPHCGMPAAIPFSAERWSFCGFATAIAAFNNVNNFTGIIYIIGACFWVLESLLCLWALREAWAFWRSVSAGQEAEIVKRVTRLLPAYSSGWLPILPAGWYQVSKGRGNPGCSCEDLCAGDGRVNVPGVNLLC